MVLLLLLTKLCERGLHTTTGFLFLVCVCVRVCMPRKGCCKALQLVTVLRGVMQSNIGQRCNLTCFHNQAATQLVMQLG